MDTGKQIIDNAVARLTDTVPDVGADECRQWLSSPITKALTARLEDCGIINALQFDDSQYYAILHLMVPFDVKHAMIDKQKREQKEE